MSSSTLDHPHLSPDTRAAEETLAAAIRTEALTQAQVWGVVAAAAFASTTGTLLDDLTRRAHHAKEALLQEAVQHCGLLQTLARSNDVQVKVVQLLGPTRCRRPQQPPPNASWTWTRNHATCGIPSRPLRRRCSTSHQADERYQG